VFIGQPIDDFVGNLVIAQLLFLEAEDPDRDINLYINSARRRRFRGLAIYDTMQFIRRRSHHLHGPGGEHGGAASPAGAPGKRSALPHSRIMIHQPLGAARGRPRHRDLHEGNSGAAHRADDILVRHSGQPLAKIEKDTDRNFFMSAEEAKGYRIVDKVITKLEPSKERKAEPARSAEARRMKKRSIRRIHPVQLLRPRSGRGLAPGLRPVGLHLQRA